MKHIGDTNWLLLLAISLVGCVSSNRTVIHLNQMNRVVYGMTVSQLETSFTTKSVPQFRADIDHQEIRCVSYTFETPKKICETFYFVFTNGALAKIVVPPVFEYEKVPYKQNSWRTVRKSWNPEERMASVLKAPAISIETMRVMLSRNAPPKSRSYNMAPALVILAPVLVAASPMLLSQKIKRTTLAEKFDPNRVQPGMTRQEVEERFGPMIHRHANKDATETVYYGLPKVGVKLVAVVFDDEKAIRVFSNGFLDFEKVRTALTK
jgi:hypothetical protein